MVNVSPSYVTPWQSLVTFGRFLPWDTSLATFPALV